MNFVATLLMVLIVILVLTNYQKCGKDNILVIYNKLGPKPVITKILYSGGSNIIPFVQGGLELSVIPLTQRVDLHNILSKGNERLSIFFLITTQFSKDTRTLQNAVNNLAGYSAERITNKIQDIAINYLITEISKTYINEMENEEWFLEKLKIGLTIELKKIGVNLKNITISNVKQGDLEN